ncbi:hypothetical protein [Actinoplanes sp. NPDC051494]|uniref:hypothetical protein n=1 Tax=Actinoplanes sp. NPDC051494 TaxID=3363907 RepID=UPI0037BB6528
MLLATGGAGSVGHAVIQPARWAGATVIAMAGRPAQARLVLYTAFADGALPVVQEHGLPLHHFPLARTADAHRTAEGGTVGKVLVTR